MAEEKKKATTKTTEKKEVAKKEVEKKTSTKKTTPETKNIFFIYTSFRINILRDIKKHINRNVYLKKHPKTES